MVSEGRIELIIKTLEKATKGMMPPASISIVDQFGRDPYLVLISCILSLRTRDTVSLPASIRLFEHAKTPSQMLALSLEQIQKLIYPVGFYRNKSRAIHQISAILISNYSSQVPNAMEELLTLPGVGRKTANLVLAEGFGIPAMVVDTHVHRISNRLGLVSTKAPEETEKALRELLPKKYWIQYTRLLVMWGQNICVPISPFCSKCPIFDLCQRKGVTRSR